MDYEILLSSLQNKSSEFEGLKSSVKSLTEEGKSSLNSLSGTEASGLYDAVTKSFERLDKGYNNCNTWLNEYVSGLNSLESSLASFSSSHIDAPKEFKGEFIDLFGKKVIPTLKSNGDKNANLDLGQRGVKEITLDQITSCANISEYLDLVMPAYTYYCKKYGIKYPGVLALQPVFEHSAPQGISSGCATKDNNLGGLKYSESIPNATPGTYPSDGTGGQYSHFDNVSDYVEAACWNIAEGSYYTDAMAQDNADDFAISLVNTWVGHDWDNYAYDLVNYYKEYGLDKYEL